MRAFLAALVLLLPISLCAAELEEDLLKRGDAYEQKLQTSEALKLYQQAEKLAPQDPEVLTRIARQYRHLMADTSSKEQKLRLGRTSLDYALKATAAGPDNSEAQLSPAISWGKMLPLLGTKEQVEASPKIKAAVDRALALNPRNDSAWHVLGRWNRVLADVTGVKRALAGAIFGPLPVGSNSEAERCLQRAIAINPGRLIHYIELGRIYAQMGRKADARLYLNRGLGMPNVEKDDAEMKAVGRELLGQLK